MAWYEYKCITCGHKFDKMGAKYKELVYCPLCRGIGSLVPSVPAKRKDHIE